VDQAIEAGFRILAYVMFGFSMEVVFAVTGIERMVGATIDRRVPRKYLEGLVSLYMAPLHGLGVFLAIEPLCDLIGGWAWPLRYLIWCAVFTIAEIGYGWLQDKILGFHTWDYYAKSRWRIHPRGYSLWTLVPAWGVAGLVIEVYSGLMRHLSPHVAAYFLGS
jgi:hypothetical protein